ncbi:MAG: hypothetical protein DSY76_08460 [Bacteroidetes bacterium]|nr:MAG: hypothetical protein DSY76_08460 [Bacteroidota bacterium]
MKKRYVLLLFIIGLSVFSTPKLIAQSQDSTQTQATEASSQSQWIDLSCDLMSRYMWRGTQFGGNSPSIQPGIELNYKNFTLGTWGAYSTGGVHASQELDLYASVNLFKDMFTVIVTDYYFPSDTANYDYLGYDSKTGHVLEGGLIFNGTKKIPITFSAYVNFYGHDAKRMGDNPADTTTFNKDIGLQFSNYFELGYTKTLKGGIDFQAFLGFTLSNPKAADSSIGYMGEQGFYGDAPGIVNVGFTVSKGVKITKSYSLPLTASFIVNPNAKSVHLVFGLSF